MERGALSDKDFPTFSKKVIPFLHITTRIAGKKYDGLLGEKGFRGFPSLAFMDASGKVVGEPADRTVAGFDKTRALLENYHSLLARQEDGEKGLEFELFLAEYGLGKVSGRQALKKLDGFEGLTEKQKSLADQIRLDERVKGLLQSARDDSDIARVSEELLEILDSGKLPSKELMLDFWAVLAHTAQVNRDAKLLGRCIEGLRQDFSELEKVQAWAKKLDSKLKTFD